MYEVLLTICLSLPADEGGAACRDMLLPGYETTTLAECEAQLSNLAATYEAPRCAPVGAALPVTQVAPGVFVHLGQIAEPEAGNRGDVANLGFVIGQDSVAVIDAGAARWIGEALWRAIRARTNKPVSHMILTHMHPDHVLGADALHAAGAAVVGHSDLPRALADRQANYIESLTRLIGADFAGTVTVGVDMTVAPDTPVEIDLGNRVLALHAWPAAHTGTDLTVLDRATGTLFVGDLVFDEHTPALDGHLMGWQAVLDQLSQWQVTKVVPGHGGPVLDWPEGGAAQMRYLQVLERDTRAAVEAGHRIGDAVETIAQSEAAHWKLFEAFNPRNATVAFTELEWD